MDETTDSCGRFVANVIIGELIVGRPGGSFLLACEALSATNSTTSAQLFCKSLAILWRGETHHERVLLFVTDAASYMKKAGQTLQGLFPKMCHVTCVAHGLHRVAEEVRQSFPDVDSLIANMKKIFLKAPSRVQAFKAALDIPLPPSPIVTRWGTWIQAVAYYAAHFENLKNFISDHLDADEATSISRAREVFGKSSLKTDLATICSMFGALPTIIEKLETKGMPLLDAMSLIGEFRSEMRNIRGPRLRNVRDRASTVFGNNVGLQQLSLIAASLQGVSSEEIIQAIENYTVDDLSRFRFAPVVSVEVERSFSKFKAFLRDNRRSFDFENMKAYVVVLCNQ